MRAILLALAIGYPVIAFWQIHSGRLRDRLDAVLVLVIGVVFLFFARSSVDWQETPPWLWLIGLALLAASVVRAGWVWSDLYWTKSRRRGRRITSATIQLAIAAALIVVLL